MSYNIQGYNGFVDGSAYYGAGGYYMPQPMYYPMPMPPQAYPPPSAGSGNFRARGRGFRGAHQPSRVRGASSSRGRGGSRTWVNPAIANRPAPLRPKAPEPTSTNEAASSSASSSSKGRGSANRVLVNNPTTARPTPLPQTQSAAALETPSRSKPGQHIVLNGITFIVGKSGKKLIRNQKGSSAQDKAAETPVQVNYAGHEFVRTKSGNLISKSVIRTAPTPSSDPDAMQVKRQRLNTLVNGIKNVQNARSSGTPRRKKNTPCRFFQKSGTFSFDTTRSLSHRGECRNARVCPYVHDSSKIAICPRFLRNACDNTEATCGLSHSPNEHRMPHCVHFPNCKLGSSCMYPHVHTAPDAAVCRDFAVFGWCDLGASKCPLRHVNECPEFSERGTCSLGRGCKLPHVLRRKRDPNAEEVHMPAVPFAKRSAATAGLDDEGAAEREPSIATSEAEQQESDDDAIDTARVKRSKVDHVEANTDFITFDEASDDEHEVADEMQDDQDDAASVDSVEVDSAEESEPSSSEDEGDSVAAPKSVKAAEAAVEAQPQSETSEADVNQSFQTARDSSVADDDEDNFDPNDLVAY